MKRSVFLLFFAVTTLAGQTATPTPGSAATQDQIRILSFPPGQTLSPEQKHRLIDAAKQLQLRMHRLAEDQTGCPVVLTSASLSPYLMMLRASGGDNTYAPAAKGGVDLEFRNTSGKEIRSMQLQAEFLARKSIYDLQANKITLLLSVSGTGDVDAAIKHLRHLPVASPNHPVALSHVTLKQVVFDDGSMWAAPQDNACGMSPDSVLRVAQ